MDAAGVAGGLPHHEEADVTVAVVDESVRKTGAGAKADAIALRKPAQLTIEPEVGLTLEHEYEFLLIGLGMRP